MREGQKPSISTIADSACVHDKTNLRCVKYIGNYDGDTITVDIQNVHPLLGEKISVRINGINTAELNSKKSCEKEVARKAKALVESALSAAKQIDLLNIKRDKYFRILADVSADQQSIKYLLLKNNLAHEYDGETKPKVDWCRFTK